MNGGEGSAEELMWLLEERRRRAGDIEEQLSSEKNPEVARGLKGMLAMLKDEIAEKVGFTCRVILAASHDTASAVLAVPTI